MKFTEEMINEDEKRWHARDVVTELGYCGNYMRDRRDMKNIDIRFYAYIMRQAHAMLKEQETKTGKWIPVTNGRGGMECSICHDYAPSYQDCTEYLSEFCPNCGAKMESR